MFIRPMKVFLCANVSCIAVFGVVSIDHDIIFSQIMLQNVSLFFHTDLFTFILSQSSFVLLNMYVLCRNVK